MRWRRDSWIDTDEIHLSWWWNRSHRTPVVEIVSRRWLLEGNFRLLRHPTHDLTVMQSDFSEEKNTHCHSWLDTRSFKLPWCSAHKTCCFSSFWQLLHYVQTYFLCWFLILGPFVCFVLLYFKLLTTKQILHYCKKNYKHHWNGTNDKGADGCRFFAVLWFFFFFSSSPGRAVGTV